MSYLFLTENKLKEERFVLAHGLRGISVHHSGTDKAEQLSSRRAEPEAERHPSKDSDILLAATPHVSKVLPPSKTVPPGEDHNSNP